MMRTTTTRIAAGLAALSVGFGAALGAPGGGAAEGDDFGREGSGESRAAKDALEGQPPPALDVSGWMNTDAPLALSELRGKVVLLKFWGVW